MHFFFRVVISLLGLLLISCQSMQSSPVAPDFSRLKQAIQDTDEGYLQWYIANGFDLNRSDSDGKTALMLAAQLGKDNIAKLLIHAGANLTAKDGRDFDVMFYVANRNRIKIAQMLLEAGYPIQLENESNAMNLLMAIDYKYLDLVNLLIDKGKAKLDFPNLEKPKSLLVEAILEDTGIPFIESLLERGASINAIHRGRHQHDRDIIIDYNPVIAAILVNNTRVLTFLALRGGSTDKLNGIERNDDAAYYAVQMNSPELLEIVLNNAVYSNPEKKYQQILIDAARSCAECISIVARDGINPDYYGDDEERMTPLMRAAWNNGTHQVLLFLKLGAKVNQRDKQGRTALYLAAGNGYLDTVKILLEHGADAKIGTEKVKSPMINAINYGHYLTADYLKQATNDKTDIEAIILSREKALFFSQENLESCREQTIDNHPHQICIESNYAKGGREYLFTVKLAENKIISQPIKALDGMIVRHFSIFRLRLTPEKILIRIPEVSGMPNRYKHLIDRYYVLDVNKWQLKPVWTSPKCDYPCAETIVSPHQDGSNLEIQLLQKDFGSGEIRKTSFNIED